MPFAPFSFFKLKFVGNETFIFHTSSDGFSALLVFLSISIIHFGTVYH
jgi:hypothetical protein